MLSTLPPDWAQWLSLSQTCFWRTDVDGHILALSGDFHQLPPHIDLPDMLADAPHRALADIICGQDPTAMQAWQIYWRNLAHSSETPETILTVKTNHHLPRYYKVRGEAVLTDGQITGYRGCVTDTTQNQTQQGFGGIIEQRLAATLNAVPHGVAVFDPSDHLMFANEILRQLLPEIADLLNPGVHFSQLVRAGVERGLQDIQDGQHEKLITLRLKLHRSGYGTRQILLADGRWLEISEYITPDQCVVISWTDITAAQRREQALTSLLEDENDTIINVPQRAARAIRLAFGCRWAGVVRLSPNRQQGEVVCFLNHNHETSGQIYRVDKGPCQQVYLAEGLYRLRSGFGERYPADELVGDGHAVSYWGMPLWDNRGEIMGHIFAADDKTAPPQYLQYQREIFALIAHWVEMEFRRQELHSQIVVTQKRFQDFAEVASDWFWEVNARFAFTLTSEHADYHVQQLLRQHLVDAHTHDHHHYLANMPSQTIEGKIEAFKPFRDVYIERPETGDIYLISGRPIYDSHGVFLGYRGTANNVTKLFHVQARANAAEKRLLEAVESSPEAFVLFDKNNKLVICNQKFTDIFFTDQQYMVTAGADFNTLQEAYMKHHLSHLTPTEKEAWRCKRQAARIAAYQGLVTENFQENYANGRYYLAIEHATHDQGVATFYVDITDIREQEKVLREAAKQAEQASRTKSEFLANISHELRTPLNAIIGFSEIIRDGLVGTHNSPKYQEYIQDIHHSGQHLMEIINDLLDLSKAEAGMIDFQERETSIAEIVTQSIKILQPKADKAQVKLTQQLPHDMTLLWIDPKRFKQIWLNLISNAIKFTPEGGAVTVGGQLDEHGITLWVEDTGIGMADEDIPRALQAFGQIDSSLSRKYTGTGLGLPLTKKLVELCDGTLQVYSKLGQGTKVVISFKPTRLVSE